MSFSSEVKKELLAEDARARHCQAAELAAMVSGAGRVRRQCAGGQPGVTLAAENRQVVCRYVDLLGKVGIAMPQITQAQHLQQKNKVSYIADISGEEAARLFSLLKIKLQDLGAGEEMAKANSLLLQHSCCKRAFLRGAFLVSGSISNPKKSYHFEIVCSERPKAVQIQEQLGYFGLEAKIVTRKNHEITYLKEGSQIVDALNIMGAHVALMDLENIRIMKEMRNDINRRVNCETANINKTVNAAYRQQEAIRFLQGKGILQGLPRQLQEMAGLRMEYPEATIKELGGLCSPPVGKSGVNHRLRRLEEAAGQMGYGKKG